MENDPRRRRPRGRRSPRDAQKPTRPPAQPRPPGIRGGSARDQGQARGARRGEPPRGAAPGREARGGRPPRSRSRPPSAPGDLRVGTPCLIVLDCRDGEPDRTGAAATFEGFFDLETGEPRRQGTGFPRLRVAVPVPPAIAAAVPIADRTDADPAPEPLRASAPPTVERLWGFECWWRPDPARAGLIPSDHEELEQSKKLIRGLLRDTRRAGRSLQPR